jgi:hypothetical protein
VRAHKRVWRLVPRPLRNLAFAVDSWHRALGRALRDKKREAQAGPRTGPPSEWTRLTKFTRSAKLGGQATGFVTDRSAARSRNSAWTPCRSGVPWRSALNFPVPWRSALNFPGKLRQQATRGRVSQSPRSGIRPATMDDQKGENATWGRNFSEISFSNPPYQARSWRCGLTPNHHRCPPSGLDSRFRSRLVFTGCMKDGAVE